jgi:hypothetical protein
MNILTTTRTFFLLAFVAFLLPVKNVTAQRIRASFNKDWKFKLDSINDYSVR